MLILTRNRPRAASLALLFIMVLLMVPLLMLLLVAPALATPTDWLTIGFNPDKAILAAFVVILVLLLIKVFFAIGAAAKAGQFDVRRLPGYLKADVLPYMIPLAGMAVASVFVPLVLAIYIPSTVAYGGKLAAEIRDNWGKFYGANSAPPDAPTANQTE